MFPVVCAWRACRRGAPDAESRLLFRKEHCVPVRITVRPGENPDKLIQRFKRTISKEGILKEVKKRKYYEKPSEKRRREAKDRQKALRKAQTKRGTRSRSSRSRSR
jgi:small subunit ribosomal protein S21